MAKRVANGTANFSSTTLWETNTNVPTLHATTNIATSTTGVFSATFTAPNLVNKCTGVIVLMTTRPSTNWKMTLQESTVDTAAASTITFSDLPTVAPNWVYFRFATPYTFTTTTAGAYRFKLQNITSSAGVVAADSGGLNFAYMAYDDRTGALGATDDIFVLSPNANTAIAVTVDGTSGSFGSGTDTASPTSTNAAQRTLGSCLTIGGSGASSSNAILKWDTISSATLVYKGNVNICSGGELQMGTVASPYPAGQLARFSSNPVATGDHGVLIGSGGRLTLQGAAKSSTTLWKTKYVSGTGVAASPLVTADAVNWSVGDEIAITATSSNATNYNETESRFIITVNSPTSYVVSTSKGGAEAALTFTHNTNAWILNVERNVLLDTQNIAKAFYLDNRSNIDGDVQIKWARFETTGNTATGKNMIALNGTTATTVTCDYTVGYRALYRGLGFVSDKKARTHTGLIGCFQNSPSTTGALFPDACGNKTFIDCFAVGNNRIGVEIAGAVNCTFTRCYAIGNNSSNGTAGGFYLFNSSINNTFNNCEAHANRLAGVLLGGTAGAQLGNLLCGTVAPNQTVDVYAQTDTYNSALFYNSMFASTTFIFNYALASVGTEIKFHQLNQTVNNHVWYTTYGSARSTGAALIDTTIRTPGSLGLRLAPEDATNGFSWSFNIYAKANSIVNFYGWFEANAAFTGDAGASARVELWMPGSTSADATGTISKGTNAWQAISLSVQNNNTIDGLATVYVYGLTTTASAYLYADDLFNAGDTVTNSDKVTGLDTWDSGKPVSIIAPQSTSAADIWTFNTANLTTAGTTGKKLMDNLTTSKFIGLK